MPILHLSRQSEREEAFTASFGRALAAWVHVEKSLSGLFMHYTDMSEPIARAVFYSARRYDGKADMLRAVISVSDVTRANPISKAVGQACLIKADLYSLFHDAILHSRPVVVATVEGARIFLVGDKQKTYPDVSKGITIQDIDSAADNFSILGGYICVLLDHLTNRSDRVPEVVQSLEGLPNNPTHQASVQNRAVQR